MIYVHQTAESLGSKGVKLFLRSINRKEKLVRAFKSKDFRQTPAAFPRILMNVCKIETTTIKNRPVTILTPKRKTSKKVVFYAHGGGHLNNITVHHWKMIAYLIKHSGAKFIVPDYPLLPASNYKGTYEMVEETFYQTVKDVENKDLVFMGDSAGGAISLTLAEILRNKNFPTQPSQLILISPELDASKLHEDIPAIAPFDVMLSPEIFDLISPSYVGDCPRDNFMVSPALGNLDSLGKISIFTGTHDILHPYSLDLKKRLEAEGKEFNFFLYPKMIHVWTAVSLIKEAGIARNQMVELINN